MSLQQIPPLPSQSLTLLSLSIIYGKIQAVYEAGDLVKANAPLEWCSFWGQLQIPTIHGIFSVAVLWLQGLTCTGISSTAVEKQPLGVKLQLLKDTELRSEQGSESHLVRLKWKVCYSVTDFFLKHGYPSSPRLCLTVCREKRCTISKWGDSHSENNIKLMFLSCKTRPGWYNHQKKDNKTTPNKPHSSSHICSSQKRVFLTTIPLKPCWKAATGSNTGNLLTGILTSIPVAAKFRSVAYHFEIDALVASKIGITRFQGFHSTRDYWIMILFWYSWKYSTSS